MEQLGKFLPFRMDKARLTLRAGKYFCSFSFHVYTAQGFKAVWQWQLSLFENVQIHDNPCISLYIMQSIVTVYSVVINASKACRHRRNVLLFNLMNTCLMIIYVYIHIHIWDVELTLVFHLFSLSLQAHPFLSIQY